MQKGVHHPFQCMRSSAHTSIARLTEYPGNRAGLLLHHQLVVWAEMSAGASFMTYRASYKRLNLHVQRSLGTEVLRDNGKSSTRSSERYCVHEIRKWKCALRARTYFSRGEHFLVLPDMLSTTHDPTHPKQRRGQGRKRNHRYTRLLLVGRDGSVAWFLISIT